MTTNIQINPLTLRFPEELERIFIDDYFKKSLNQVRFALLLVLFILAISGILDQWTSPDFRAKALFFRYGFLFPVTLAFLMFTFSRFLPMSYYGISIYLKSGVWLMSKERERWAPIYLLEEKSKEFKIKNSKWFKLITVRFLAAYCIRIKCETAYEWWVETRKYWFWCGVIQKSEASWRYWGLN